MLSFDEEEDLVPPWARSPSPPPPAPPTPEHYWSLDFPTTEQCISRGHVEALPSAHVPKPPHLNRYLSPGAHLNRYLSAGPSDLSPGASTPSDRYLSPGASTPSDLFAPPPPAVIKYRRTAMPELENCLSSLLAAENSDPLHTHRSTRLAFLFDRVLPALGLCEEDVRDVLTRSVRVHEEARRQLLARCGEEDLRLAQPFVERDRLARAAKKHFVARHEIERFAAVDEPGDDFRKHLDKLRHWDGDDDECRHVRAVRAAYDALPEERRDASSAWVGRAVKEILIGPDSEEEEDDEWTELKERLAQAYAARLGDSKQDTLDRLERLRNVRAASARRKKSVKRAPEDPEEARDSKQPERKKAKKVKLEKR